MDLDDLVDLPRSIIDEVQQAAVSRNEHITDLLLALVILDIVNQWAIEIFASACVVKGHWVARQVSILDFEEADVLSSAGNQTGVDRIIESNIDQIEIA